MVNNEWEEITSIFQTAIKKIGLSKKEVSKLLKEIEMEKIKGKNVL